MLFALFTLALSEEINCNEVDFGISVDAGSSATRLYIYAWNTSYQYPIPVPVGKKCEVNRPIHTAYYDDSVVETVFKELISCADKQIVTEKCLNKSRTDFYVYFTTAVRSLNLNEQYLVKNRTFNYIKKNTAFNITESMMDVIDPNEEGIYTWITVNLLKNTLEKAEDTYPVVSMGTKSVQVVFSSEQNEKYADNLYVVNINNINHTLFCLSNDHLGIDSGVHNHTRSIAQEVGRSTIESPCYLKDYKTTIGNIDVTGTGSSKQCTEKLEEKTLMRDKSQCTDPYCTFENIPMPEALNKRPVFATNVFAYAAEYFGWTDDDTMTLQQQIDFANKFCGLSVEEATEQYGNESLEYLMEYCLQLSYTNEYLLNGFGVPATSHVNRLTTLNTTDNLNTIQLDYLYGTILARAYGGLSIKEAPRKFSKFLAIALAVIAGIIVIVVVVIIVLKARKIKKEKDEDGRNKRLLETENSSSSSSTNAQSSV
ncbi:hypothetical protein TRFO_19279 [Tritrichomonas foetus]|uniref:Uncharacterized protein n=1 Tax=Tritrichomonas foetus TaxID=1144522 RepID=A0A1J4KPF6_9EUKA|nr:hypothetical protein TRFO_19279 [Tritrichomonas foetus]|eukprot:OHT11301.1 hypothetical protein TRFO_19279 [Tritrichomonas foetus]